MMFVKFLPEIAEVFKHPKHPYSHGLASMATIGRPNKNESAAWLQHRLPLSLIGPQSVTMFTACRELRRVLFLAPSVCVFCLCMKYLGNGWTNLRQIHKEGVFGPSLGRVWRSRSNVKGQGHQGQKNAFSTLSATCVRFMFCKTSLASSSLG